ncbi:hypothetical protein [Cohnella panacarvi]|uniref:hypothetical protein n=1 Tax=Cohnella panacarvi TaxID=400776 RepID=UPI00047CFFFC|nr:hypothetical protein [Cohnella panacarvi]
MHNKKKWVKWGTAAVAALMIGTAVILSSVQADTQASTPGSTNDPLVTKGYVDSAIANLVQQEIAKLGPSAGGGDEGSAKLEVVTVPFGSKLIVSDGGEMIVRSGKAIVVSSDANGLSDLTDGLDIKPGKPVGNNHLILNPRGQRGVEADPKQTKGLIVLVRGAFTLQ